MEVYITSWVKGELFSWLIQIASEVALNAVMFTGVFQIMTREKIKWVHAIYGGFLTALLWQPGRYIIATYLISERYTPFGVVGAFLAVLLWIFYGFNVLLFGGTVVCVAGKENTAASESNIESDSESSEDLAR